MGECCALFIFIFIFIKDGKEDRWLWHLHLSQKYTVSDTYNYLSSLENIITYVTTNMI